MTPSILGLTFNDLTSLYRTKPEINTSKSETDPSYMLGSFLSLKKLKLMVKS